MTAPARHDGGEHDPLREAMTAWREELARQVSQASPRTWARKSEVAKDIHRGCADRLIDALLADRTVRDELARRERDAAKKAAHQQDRFLTETLADLLRLTYSVQLDSGTPAARAESERVADVFRDRIGDHARERERRRRAASLDPTTGKEQP